MSFTRDQVYENPSGAKRSQKSRDRATEDTKKYLDPDGVNLAGQDERPSK